jgi:hypothetical protein
LIVFVGVGVGLPDLPGDVEADGDGDWPTYLPSHLPYVQATRSNAG